MLSVDPRKLDISERLISNVCKYVRCSSQPRNYLEASVKLTYDGQPLTFTLENLSIYSDFCPDYFDYGGRELNDSDGYIAMLLSRDQSTVLKRLIDNPVFEILYQRRNELEFHPRLDEHLMKHCYHGLVNQEYDGPEFIVGLKSTNISIVDLQGQPYTGPMCVFQRVVFCIDRIVLGGVIRTILHIVSIVVNVEDQLEAGVSRMKL